MNIVYAVAAVLMLGALITVHEFGHFLVGRAFGVSVKVFSIGFGSRLFGFVHNGTDYRVSAIPFGGYVRWVGADPFSDGGGDDDDWIDAKGSFVHKPAWQRLLILLAGPATNLAVPVVVFTALMLAGEPQPQSDVGRIDHGSVAHTLGVVPGDRIVEVNGTPVTTWIDVLEAFADDESDPVEIVVQRGGERVPYTLGGMNPTLPFSPWDYGIDNMAPDATALVDDLASPAGAAGVRTGDVIAAIDGNDVRTWVDVQARLATAQRATLEICRKEGFRPSEAPCPVESVEVVAVDGWSGAGREVDDVVWRTFGLASATLGVGQIGEESAALRGGVKVGDRLLKVGTRDVWSWSDVVRGVAESTAGRTGEAAEEGGAEPILIRVRRAGEIIDLTVTPDVEKVMDDLGRYRIRPMAGIGGAGAWTGSPEISRPYPLPDAVKRAFQETWMIGRFILEQVGLLFTGGAAVSKSLGGGIEMLRQAAKAAEEGVFRYARLLGQLSISLGVLNLLPIPVLDGGNIAMYAAEMVRGRPLPVRIRERMQQAGLVFIVALLLFVTVNDITRAVKAWLEPS